MNENPTPEEVRASIVAKSNQLNADDLITGPITVEITGVTRGDKEQPVTVAISGGHQPYKPCKTMRRVLIAVYSDDPKLWIGQRMTLFCDPSVVFGGVRVGGVRISHLSGLAETKTFMLTKTRGKKEAVTVHPIAAISPEDQKYIAAATEELNAAESLEELQGHGEMLKTKSKAIQDAIRPAYATRLKALKQPTPEQPDTLTHWLSGIPDLASVQSCAEFREAMLADCPESLIAEVGAALAAHQDTLQKAT